MNSLFPQGELVYCDVNTTSLNKKGMSTDMYRFKKKKHSEEMNKTQREEIWNNKRAKPQNNHNYKGKRPLTLGGCEHVLKETALSGVVLQE